MGHYLVVKCVFAIQGCFYNLT